MRYEPAGKCGAENHDNARNIGGAWGHMLRDIGRCSKGHLRQKKGNMGG